MMEAFRCRGIVTGGERALRCTFLEYKSGARYPVVRSRKWGLIGFRDVPGAPPLLPKLIAIVVSLNRDRSFIVSPVVNAEMHPILTRYELTLAISPPLRLQSTNRSIRRRRKVFQWQYSRYSRTMEMHALS